MTGGRSHDVPARGGHEFRAVAPDVVDDAVRSPSRPLDPDTRATMENRLGHDFSGVRVHTGETAAAAAEAVHANAFTTGRDIVFGAGRYAPDTSAGRGLLAHELAHTLQPTAPATIRRDEVKDVISPTVRLRQTAVTSASDLLARRIQKRRDDIEQAIEDLGPSPKSAKAKERAAALRKDLDKGIDEIIATPDSRYLNKGLRTDIIASARSENAQTLALKKAEKQWSRYDPIFAGKDVAAALGKKSLSAVELKALIAQESGNLTENEQKGDIAGVAQMGAAEEKLAGGKKGDRKVPEKAIVLAAKLLNRYAANLDKALTSDPADADHARFVMASYNAGVNAIAKAQEAAIKDGRTGTTWESLVAGGKDSPLYKGIKATYPAKKVDQKYAEVVDYITKIEARLPRKIEVAPPR